MKAATKIQSNRISGEKFECSRSWITARSGQTKNYEIGICLFSATRTVFGNQSKDWLVRNVSE